MGLTRRWVSRILLLFPIVLLSARHAQLVTAGDSPITLRYDFAAPRIVQTEKYDSVTIEGLANLEQAGLPRLPIAATHVLLPFGQQVSHIEVTCDTQVALEGSYILEPGQEPLPLSHQGPITPTLPSPEVYQAPGPFPGVLHSATSIQARKGYQMLVLTLYPVQYAPQQGNLSYCPTMTVQVTTEPAPSRQDRMLRHRPLQWTSDREEVRALADNPDAQESYPVAAELAIRAHDAMPILDQDTPYDYVIVTNEDLMNAPGPHNFQALAVAKEARGISTVITTTEWISATYNGLRPDGGQDLQTKIRNFVLDAYQTWGTEYVLLGGDGDGVPIGGETGDAIVPARGLASISGEIDHDIPADMYYACLDGTFDHDGDGIYGEPNDGPGGGEVDLYAEVYVGRAAVDSAAELGNFVAKTLAYQAEEHAYLRNAWMVGEDLGWPSPWGGDRKDAIKDGSSAAGYTTVGFEDSPYAVFFDTRTLYDRDYPDHDWPPSDIVEVINSPAHIINHNGHADMTHVMKLSNSDVDHSLTNGHYFVGYSQGCYDAAFDNRDAPPPYGSGGYLSADSIGEHLTSGSHGAVAFVGNSRYGWGHGTDPNLGPSQHFDRQFWDAILGENILNLGRANQESKQATYDVVGPGGFDWAMRWVYYELNVFGDPELVIKTGAGIVHQGHTIDDDNDGESGGDGDGRVDAGETIEMPVTLFNARGSEVRAVTATLSTSDPYVTATNHLASYGDIASGGSATSIAPYVFYVEHPCPDDHWVAFTLDITGTTDVTGTMETWSDGFQVEIHAEPQIAIAPASHDVTLDWEDEITRTLVISNTGPAVLEFELSETGGGYVSAGLPLGCGGPDDFGYTYKDSNELYGPAFDFIDISGTGTPVALEDDSYAGPFAIGFDFPFYGNDQTAFYISSNGFLTFGSGSSDYGNDCPLPSTNSPHNLIAALWDDLDPGNTGDLAYYQAFASCPYGSGACAVVQYRGYHHYPGGGTIAGTFEVILFDGGSILIQFQDAGAEEGSGSTTGIENATGTDGLNYGMCNTHGSLQDSMAVCFQYPGAPPCSGPIDVPWLAADPTAGTLPGYSAQPITITLTASQVDWPGIYRADLIVYSNDPYSPTLGIPVTMTIVPPTTWGKLEGSVSSMGHCDVNTYPIEGAQVYLEGSGGYTITLETNAAGIYQHWLNSTENPYTVTVSYPGHSSAVATATVGDSATTIRDFALRWQQPCMSVTPAAISAGLEMNSSTTLPMRIANSGAISLEFDIQEWNRDLGIPALAAGTIPVPWVREPLDGFDLTATTTKGVLAPGGTEPLDTLAAGDVLAQWNSDLALTWGVAYNSDDDTVWLGNIGVAGGDDLDHEFQTNGQTTGRTLDTSHWIEAWAADMAYNPNTGMIWQINVGGDNCIYELDPLTGAETGNLVCDPASVWNATSQRGLAYDPTTDTFFIGSWNGPDIYHIDNTGAIIEQWPLYLSVSGLAYNCEANLLFIIENSDTDTISILDVLSGTIVGSFTVAGFGDYAGVGLAIDCNGNLWAANQNDNNAYLIDSGVPGNLCRADVHWLSVDPITGTVNADGGLTTTDVTLDAAHVAQPGEYYATLRIHSDDPVNSQVSVPVTMTVSPPPTYGKLEGSVYSLGHCDAHTTTLEQAQVSIESGPLTLATDAGGRYTIWLDQGTYTVTVSADEHLAHTAAVTITAQAATVHDFFLHWLQPCLSIEPDCLTVTLDLSDKVALPLTLTNGGVAAMEFAFSETTGQLASPPSHPYGLGDFTARAASPAPLTSVTADPNSSYVYAQENYGYEFYRYNPYSDSWTALSSCPLYSGNNGGAAYLNGKVYTAYAHDSDQVGVYDIASNSWSAISNGLERGTGNIASDGRYIYLVVDTVFVRYDPGSGSWKNLASPPISFNPWGGMSHLNGRIYGHTGNDHTGFARYEITSDRWTTLSSIPGGAVLGSAIDPSREVYYTYGSYGGRNWYGFDLASGTWNVSTIPLFSINDGGMAYVGKPGVSGIYLVQGESGTGFGRLETAPHSPDVLWLSENPITGTVPAYHSMPTSVTMDGSQVPQPGTHHAILWAFSNDPFNPEVSIPVTMTVRPDPSAGKLRGIVRDVRTGEPLKATADVEGDGSTAQTTSNPTSGVYFIWLKAGTYSVTVSAPGYLPRTAGMTVNAGLTTTQPFDLTPIAPWIRVEPTTLEESLRSGQTITRYLHIQNIGQADLTFNIEEERGYRAVDSHNPGGPVFDWIDISTTGTDLGLDGDDTHSLLPIGFDFPFYGNTYTDTYASSNGLLSFGSGTWDYLNDPIPHPAPPNNLLAPFWDDQSVYYPDDEHVYYQTFGSAPNRYLVVQWRCRDLSTRPPVRPYEYEAILHEDGATIFQYKDMGGWYEGNGCSATVGIENATGSEGVQYSYNTAVITDGLAIRFSLPSTGWLDQAPQSGMVAPDASQPVQVVFDPIGLAGGTYTMDLVIENNDAVSGTIAVPVTLIADPYRTYLLSVHRDH
jgi:hypothetical protein